MAAEQQVCLIWENPSESYPKEIYLLPASEYTPTIATLFSGEWFMNRKAIFAITNLWEKAGYQENYDGLNIYENVKLVIWLPREPCYCRKYGKCRCGAPIVNGPHIYNPTTLSYCYPGEGCTFCIRPFPPATLIPIEYEQKEPIVGKDHKELMKMLSQSKVRNDILVTDIQNISKIGRKCLVLVRFIDHGKALVEQLKGLNAVYVGLEHPLVDADILVMTVPTLIKNTSTKSLPPVDETKVPFVIPQDVVLTYPPLHPPVVLRSKTIHYTNDVAASILQRMWKDCISALTK